LKTAEHATTKLFRAMAEAGRGKGELARKALSDSDRPTRRSWSWIEQREYDLLAREVEGDLQLLKSN